MRNNLAWPLVVLALVVCVACSKSPGTRSGSPRELVVFHAGSLSVPFRDVSAAFAKLHPGVVVKAEAAGSRDTARKVSELGRSCDVLASADFEVIRNLLMPKHASFEIRFATNEMVLAYTSRSAYNERLKQAAWADILLQDDVAFGRSDPDSDPCGYRTIMLFDLAEKFYQSEGLARRLTHKHGQKYIRPKETDLLALLESGEIDYIFIYRSVAEQHGLRILSLPREVNLQSPALADLYRTVSVEVTGKKPGETITRRGAPIVYSVTIPNNARQGQLAEAYLELLLAPRGRAIMENHGQPALRPAQASSLDAIPERLKSYCQ